MKFNKNRGMLRLRKGLVHNLHPKLRVLDDTEIPFEGYFDLDNRDLLLQIH